MTKILFLGIDALDSVLLDAFAPQMPTFSRLRREGRFLPVVSTFPPDSDTAWATISTGLNPAQHGIVRFVDPLEKSYQILNVGSKNDVLRGKTFWEVLGQAGHPAHAIFPHLCYPVWPTPGIMVARGSSVVEVQANPPEVVADYPDADVFTGIRGFPDRSVPAMQSYAARLERMVRADTEFSLRLMKKQPWELFFTYFSTLDAIGHFFWNYHDPQDPGYVKGHPLETVILNAYKLYDEIVSQFLAAVDNDTTVLILSDHGQGARPYNLVSVNEILRQAGFLSARDLKKNIHIGLFEKTKRFAIKTISRFGLGRIAGRVMRNFPAVVQTFTRPAAIDWDKTIAYATDMSGIKAYSYGGIKINREALAERDYESICREIIDLLKEGCILPDGSSLLRFIAKREDLYEGPMLDRYPDIVLEFNYGYGVGWAVHAPFITRADSYNLVPGSHRGETGVCIVCGPNPLFDGEKVDLQDVFPAMLNAFGVGPSQKKEQ
jgi:predicted AlkP superfamily phosphohydrolase/phosphomutase